MAVQYQQEPRRTDMFSEEESVHSVRKSDSSFYIRSLIAVVLVTIAGYSIKGIMRADTNPVPEQMYETETYEEYLDGDLDISTEAPENYLTELDLHLIEEETGNIENETYFWSNSYDEEGYVTSKGIRAGDTWEDFVDAYGEYYLDSAYLSDRSITGQELTVNDFVTKYIDAGKLDPGMEGFEIDFKVYSADGDMAYSEYDADYNDFMLDHSGAYDVTTLSFIFGVEDGESIIQYISSEYWAY